MPDVDVVVPCYRYGHLLPDAVRSVLDQRGVDVRVLIIDDASDDGSADVARALAGGDGRVEVRVHERNRGCYATYDEGVLEWASATYTLLLSADDVLIPGALARATDLLAAHPEVGFCYGHTPVWDGTGPRPAPRESTPKAIIYPGLEWLRRRFATSANCVSTPGVVTRTAVQQRVGGYNGALSHTADFELWMRFALQADVGYVAGADQAWYREHDANMSAGFQLDRGVQDLQQRLLAFTSVLELAGDRLPDAAALDRRVRRELARYALLRAARAYDKRRLDREHVGLLVEFAIEAVEAVTALPEWHTLRIRERLGPRVAPVLSPFVLTAAGRRLRQHWRVRRLVRLGI